MGGYERQKDQKKNPYPGCRDLDAVKFLRFPVQMNAGNPVKLYQRQSKLGENAAGGSSSVGLNNLPDTESFFESGLIECRGDIIDFRDS